MEEGYDYDKSIYLLTTPSALSQHSLTKRAWWRIPTDARQRKAHPPPSRRRSPATFLSLLP